MLLRQEGDGQRAREHVTVHALGGPHVYESDLVHQGVAHAGTGQIGMADTPTDLVSTACRAEWVVRPRRTMRADLVTCPDCAALPIGEGTNG